MRAMQWSWLWQKKSWTPNIRYTLGLGFLYHRHRVHTVYTLCIPQEITRYLLSLSFSPRFAGGVFWGYWIGGTGLGVLDQSPGSQDSA